ncbi:MAG: energy-coupling factor transporter ATPase [Candidatus Atribacteria bacterium]|nr:energy-coupling factor transporter ATPase [Candidatus Atribacteria bacterium]
MSIKVVNLTYTYGKDTAFVKKALLGVDLEIDKGEFIGLIGHTGSGKSTLIQHFNGLLKRESGQVYINGKAIFDSSVNMKIIRQKVGLVFQYPEHQLFEMSIYKDVAFGPSNMGLNKDEIDFRVKEALTSVGIDEDLYESSPFDLSGGQKRRVAIAGVLAMKPDILILDEPTAGLDPKGRDEILDKIKTLHGRFGLTIILVSHNMENIVKYVNRVIVMDKGQIKMDGPTKEIFTQIDKLEEVGLAGPQMTYLVRKLNKRGFGLTTDRMTVEEVKVALLEELKITSKVER